MSRSGSLLPLLFALLFAIPAFADGHDLLATLESPDSVQLGGTYLIRGTVTNIGTAPAHQVLASLGAGLFRNCYLNHELGTLNPGASRTLECSVSIPSSDLLVYDFGSGFNVASIPGDHDPYNNSIQKSVPIPAPPDLFIHAAGGVARPGLPHRIQMTYGNRSHTPATDTTITIFAPGRFASVPDFCTVTGNRAVCNVGTVTRIESNTQQVATLSVDIEAPDASAALFEIPVSIDANEPDAGPASDRVLASGTTHRTIFVTTAADSGSGSLRAAIEQANSEAGFELLLIAFRIPVSGQSWQTIRLESPLPRIVARSVWIDGTTQAGYFGDTNPLGPEVEVTGAGLREGSGFDVGTCNTTIGGLAINGFPGDGVRLVIPSCFSVMGLQITGNYIGTDPTGTRAVPNSRGVVVDIPGRNVLARVDDNVISGNSRSGVFVVSGVHNVTRNRIGLTPTLAPLGNGASGVYIAKDASGTDLTDNYIGFNRHFGVGLDRDTKYVAMQRNSFQANHQMAIDWGLDAQASQGPVAIPEITSVRLEDGKTIVEGTHRAFGTFTPYITVYANDVPDPSGYGEGQYWLGEMRPNGDKFTFTFDGDLRGKWVTVTATHVQYVGWVTNPPVRSLTDSQGFYITTSEFSRAVEVK